MKIFIGFSVFTLCLYGCLAGVSIISTNSTKQLLKSYEIGKSQMVSIGDPIVEIQSVYVKDSYEVLFDYQPPTKGAFGDKQPFLYRGERLEVVGMEEDNRNSLFLSGGQLLININSDGTINKGWIYTHGAIADQGVWTKERLFVKSQVPIKQDKNSFRAEILYSGLSGNTIKTIYREYSNDIARPAFSQDLQYNLDESKVIAYKSIRIEVLKVSNAQIEFKVLSDGDLPWIRK